MFDACSMSFVPTVDDRCDRKRIFHFDFDEKNQDSSDSIENFRHESDSTQDCERLNMGIDRKLDKRKPFARRNASNN